MAGFDADVGCAADDLRELDVRIGGRMDGGVDPRGEHAGDDIGQRPSRQYRHELDRNGINAKSDTKYRRLSSNRQAGLRHSRDAPPGVAIASTSSVATWRYRVEGENSRRQPSLYGNQLHWS